MLATSRSNSQLPKRRSVSAGDSPPVVVEADEMDGVVVETVGAGAMVIVVATVVTVAVVVVVVVVFTVVVVVVVVVVLVVGGAVNMTPLHTNFRRDSQRASFHRPVKRIMMQFSLRFKLLGSPASHRSWTMFMSSSGNPAPNSVPSELTKAEFSFMSAMRVPPMKKPAPPLSEINWFSSTDWMLAKFPPAATQNACHKNQPKRPNKVTQSGLTTNIVLTSASNALRC